MKLVAQTRVTPDPPEYAAETFDDGFIMREHLQLLLDLCKREAIEPIGEWSALPSYIEVEAGREGWTVFPTQLETT